MMEAIIAISREHPKSFALASAIFKRISLRFPYLRISVAYLPVFNFYPESIILNYFKRAKLYSNFLLKLEESFISFFKIYFTLVMSLYSIISSKTTFVRSIRSSSVMSNSPWFIIPVLMFSI